MALDRGMKPDPYKKFRLIIDGGFSPEEQAILDKKAEMLFEELDYAQATELDNENHSKKVPYDFTNDSSIEWDFPNPPDFIV